LGISGPIGQFPKNDRSQLYQTAAAPERQEIGSLSGGHGAPKGWQFQTILLPRVRVVRQQLL